jgi:hypothetical protein
VLSRAVVPHRQGCIAWVAPDAVFSAWQPVVCSWSGFLLLNEASQVARADAGLTVVGEAGHTRSRNAASGPAAQSGRGRRDAARRQRERGHPRLKALVPSLRVILVSAYRDRAEVFQNAAAEVSGEAFVPKDDLDLHGADVALQRR